MTAVRVGNFAACVLVKALQCCSVVYLTRAWTRDREATVLHAPLRLHGLVFGYGPLRRVVWV